MDVEIVARVERRQKWTTILIVALQLGVFAGGAANDRRCWQRPTAWPGRRDAVRRTR